ncbi:MULTISPECIES: pseudaminic acid synthase [Pseudoalteromonas]|uniref:Pseudaminic acid synthase n=1 Tax=Pseudoalteromonas amylolytica TaxID=1859457 RepID=A0A1S1MU04_9GAMM|nr:MULTISPECIES: pseudaminic acid synthase [Pseudoalteromonas]MCF6434698.1 pseudaminic acid synthase [Pseudoalteromonas sp. MMG022]OHU87569.1 pseudaminic acid synthase [Pseudoalteromonas sp. JW3]OHU91012.1 pseudaminic acid synthase [Pseudoalteromonas amylolytica]
MTFKTEFQIANTFVGHQHPCYVIAEMSANHGQSLTKAKELVYAAKESGADAIKLQTYTADTLTMDCKLPHFEATGPWQGQYLYDLYKKAYMPWDFHAELFELAQKLGLTCFSSPFDKTAVDLLEQFDAPAYKIASPELIDHQLIRDVAATKKPVIMSTGGATLAEIANAVKVAHDAGVTELALMKCTSTYPAPANSINLRTIAHMREAFGCPVGLSDHTLGNDVPLASVAVGACMIEKHFVMDKKDETADSFFSMTPDELAALVHGVRQIEQAMGTVHYPSEPSKARRCVYIIKDVAAGEVLTEKHVAQMRPGGGEIMPEALPTIIGRTTRKALARGTQLAWGDLI